MLQQGRVAASRARERRHASESTAKATKCAVLKQQSPAYKDKQPEIDSQAEAMLPRMRLKVRGYE